jgi:hypothetical protein
VSEDWEITGALEPTEHGATWSERLWYTATARFAGRDRLRIRICAIPRHLLADRETDGHVMKRFGSRYSQHPNIEEAFHEVAEQHVQSIAKLGLVPDRSTGVAFFEILLK